MEDKLDKLEQDETEDVEAHKLEPEDSEGRFETDEDDDVEAHGPRFGPRTGTDAPRT